MRDKYILSVNSLKVTHTQDKIRKVVPVYATFLLILAVCAWYYFHKAHDINKLTIDTRERLETIHKETKKLITENSMINKTQFVLRNINMEHNRSFQSYTRGIRHTINDLAYHYNISGPIIANVSYPSRYSKGVIVNMKLDISINTYDDEAIIQFVESLIVNFKGFVKIQEMVISKNKEALFVMDNNDKPVTSKLIKCKLKLNWYVMVSNKENELLDRTFVIHPKRPNIEIEDAYRTSIWEGSLMFSKDHLKKIKLLYETWQ